MATNKKNDDKRKTLAIVLELIAFITFMVIGIIAYKNHNLSELKTWSIIPIAIFTFSRLYRLPEIAGTLTALFAYLNDQGINGLPALSILLLVVLTIINIFSSEKLWSEMIKIISGAAAGSLAQAKISNKKITKK